MIKEKDLIDKAYHLACEFLHQANITQKEKFGDIELDVGASSEWWEDYFLEMAMKSQEGKI